MADPQHGGPYHPLQVTLPLYDGPLDLLLDLVRKQSLDINDLRLADLTEPYLAYVEQLQELNLDHAGEFLTIASTLIWIKSKGLLPRRFDEEELDPETVEEMLVLRLRDYQSIKDAAHQMASLDLLGRDIFPRAAPPQRPDKPTPEGAVFEEVSLFGLIDAFREVLERTRAEYALHAVPEREKVEHRLAAMVELLTRRHSLLFHEMFPPGALRPEIILTFIALLELVRLSALRVVQASPGGEVLCQATEAFLQGGVDWKSRVLGTLFDGHEPEPAEPTS